MQDISNHNSGATSHADIRLDITDLSNALDTHEDDTVHITSAERTTWNNKVDKATGTLAFTLGRDANGIYVEF